MDIARTKNGLSFTYQKIGGRYRLMTWKFSDQDKMIFRYDRNEQEIPQEMQPQRTLQMPESFRLIKQRDEDYDVQVYDCSSKAGMCKWDARIEELVITEQLDSLTYRGETYSDLEFIMKMSDDRQSIVLDVWDNYPTVNRWRVDGTKIGCPVDGPARIKRTKGWYLTTKNTLAE